MYSSLARCDQDKDDRNTIAMKPKRWLLNRSASWSQKGAESDGFEYMHSAFFVAFGVLTENLGLVAWLLGGPQVVEIPLKVFVELLGV